MYIQRKYQTSFLGPNPAFTSVNILVLCETQTKISVDA